MMQTIYDPVKKGHMQRGYRDTVDCILSVTCKK